DRIAHKAMAVGLGAAHRGIQRAALHGPAVGGQGRNVGERIGCAEELVLAAERRDDVGEGRHGAGQGSRGASARTVTVSPARSAVPASGRVPHTVPRPWTATRKPTACNRATAVRVDSPVTSGRTSSARAVSGSGRGHVTATTGGVSRTGRIRSRRLGSAGVVSREASRPKSNA